MGVSTEKGVQLIREAKAKRSPAIRAQCGASRLDRRWFTRLYLVAETTEWRHQRSPPNSADVSASSDDDPANREIGAVRSLQLSSVCC